MGHLSKKARVAQSLNRLYCLQKIFNTIKEERGCGNFTFPIPCWSSLNNSKTWKAIALVFCPIQKLFFRNICAKIAIPKSPLSPDIGQKLEGGNSDFRISVQSLIKENFHNYRTSNDIDMKLGPVTKLDKKNKTTSKKSDNNVMSANCVAIVIFSIYGQFGAFRKPGIGRLLCKTYIFIISDLLFYKNGKQN